MLFHVSSSSGYVRLGEVMSY